MMRLLVAAAVVCGVGCLAPQEDPTFVKDMRVLGMSFEPPELLAGSCDALRSIGPGSSGGSAASFAALAPLARSTTLQVLIADPEGAGRALKYQLKACSSPGDRMCTDENDFIVLDAGFTNSGVSTYPVSLVVDPGADGGFLTPDGGVRLMTLPDGALLIGEVLNNDTYRGLGGIRVPVVLEVDSEAGERIFAQKLMVFGCKFFPDQEANVTPRLPGVTFEGETWIIPREVSGRGPFTLEPLDFNHLEENYVVPSFSLEPVRLKESWKIAWYTDFGTMSPFETGGTSVGGLTGQLRSRWSPGQGTEARTVNFTMMVRDGRGGESWIQRQVSWRP